jgi:ActR/RegA family two-component response regulator
MAMPFDTLRLARRLEAAGFAPQQAGDIAEAIASLATKADLFAVKTDLQAEIAALRAGLKADMEMLRAEFKADIEILRRDMTIRLGSMMIVAVGVILAGFKLLH